MPPTTERFPAEWFERLEESPDEHFYQIPRKVVHMDDDAIASLRDFYKSHLQDNTRILDLMTAWHSPHPGLWLLPAQKHAALQRWVEQTPPCKPG